MPDGKLPLPLLQAAPRQLPPRPAEVLLSEPMLRYACNQKGCCCRGWTIPFQLEDFVRLYRALPEGERDKLGRGMEVIVSPADAPPPEEEDVSGWADPAASGGEHATKASRAGAFETSAVRATLSGAAPEAVPPGAALAAAGAAPEAAAPPDAGGHPDLRSTAREAGTAFPEIPPAPPAAGAGAPVSFAAAMDRPAAAAGASHVLESIRFAGVGADHHCRFLRDDAACGVHTDHGLWALPDICVNFPAFGYQVPGESCVELWWDPICPEVLRQLDEGDAPLELHRGGADSPAWNDPAFAVRVANAAETARAHLRGVEVSRAELEHLRAESLRGLRETPGEAWRALAAVICGYQKLQASGGLDFRAALPEDTVPFLAFLGGCVGAHGAPILVWGLDNYRRFIHAADIGPVFADHDRLLAAFDAWGPSIDTWLAPAEESLRPLMRRWMGHRFGMPFVNQTGDLRACADTIAMIYGTSLRYAGALGAVLGRVVDRPLYQVALGAAEYFYRSLVFRRESLPWFASVESYQAALFRVSSAE